MYFAEWLWWRGAVELKKDRDAFLKNNRKYRTSPLYESDWKGELDAAKKSVSTRPQSRGPVYTFNEHILEMRCGMWEEKRGLISILSLTVFMMIATYLIISTRSIVKLVNLTISYQGEPYGGTLFLATLFLGLALLALWFYIKYGLRFSRLEIFTSRHLLIRFNRTTQQVYLHRPPYCGGIVTLPWNGVTSNGAPAKKASISDIGLPLMLLWSSDFTGTLRTEVVFVGKSVNNFTELQSEWEFIRRFMDEGPEGLPRPRITSHFPWPWQAFTPQFEGLTHYFRNASWVIKCGLLLISPAFLIIGTGHWLSLLLCWKPRWPKIIREAGLPGKPIPPITTVDDYPPHIQERLRENAYLWAIRPGSRPERKKRSPATRRKTAPTTLEKDTTDETNRTDRP